MGKPEFEPCCVSNQGCLAPAGLRVNSGIIDGARSARGTCVICGERVCGACSKRTQKGRICYNCWGDPYDVDRPKAKPLEEADLVRFETALKRGHIDCAMPSRLIAEVRRLREENRRMFHENRRLVGQLPED